MKLETTFSLTVDDDGFILRECPHCEELFKWHHGPSNEEAEQATVADVYYCPLCGEPAGTNEWWTKEQLENAMGAAAPQVSQVMERELKNMERSFRGSMISVSFEVDHPNVPPTIVETEDDAMEIVSSPCHAYEPVKVALSHKNPLHCLVCGALFESF
jgi:hypothetical protein